MLIDIFARSAARAAAKPTDQQGVDEMLDQRGLIGRFFRPLLKLVDSSWKMYPIGVLFGLGFDTATEVGLLGIAAVEAGKGLPVYDILIFPLLFTAGMSLLDTTDGILMLGAYGWAFVKPMRKLYYNMVITLVSVLVALIVGAIEAASVVADAAAPERRNLGCRQLAERQLRNARLHHRRGLSAELGRLDGDLQSPPLRRSSCAVHSERVDDAQHGPGVTEPA